MENVKNTGSLVKQLKKDFINQYGEKEFNRLSKEINDEINESDPEFAIK